MRGDRGRRSTSALAGALVGAALLSGCRTMPFKAQAPTPGDAVLGLGGPVPYLDPGTPHPRPVEVGALERGGPATSRATDRTTDVYAATRAGLLSRAVRLLPPRVYVTDSRRDRLDVLDPESYRVVGHIKVGRSPRHVVLSWDLRTLWVDDQRGGLVPVDPGTGRRGQSVPISDPDDLYFTVDGRHALVMAGKLHRIEVREPHSMRLQGSIPVPCGEATHADFAADGSYAVVSCGLSARLIKVDLGQRKVAGMIDLASGAVRTSRGPRPRDVRLSPDGSVFYVADAASHGVWTVDAAEFRATGFIATGSGAYGLAPSRDGETLYVINRDDGSISVISFATRRVVRTWRLPGGASPDTGGVSADGKVLWLAGRYDDSVYAVSTLSGELIKRIKVGGGAHGLCVHPQPGRYSLGHGLR